jgi:hypothetical protein
VEIPGPVLSTIQPLLPGNATVKTRKNLFTAQTSHQEIIQETAKTTLTPVNNTTASSNFNTIQHPPHISTNAVIFSNTTQGGGGGSNKRSLNRDQRRKELIKITLENQAFLRRL